MYSQYSAYVVSVNSPPFKSLQEFDCVLKEFISYKILRDTDVPSSVWEKATVVETDTGVKHYRMDVVWRHLSSMKAPDSLLGLVVYLM